jgi:hypothetical protein
MRRLLVVVALVLAAAIALPAASAGGQASTVVSGGGQGTYGGDFDGNGSVDGTHFGMGVVISPGGAAQGHFLCLMAGNVPFLGLKLMSVEGRVTRGSADLVAGTASFSGIARVNLANGTVFTGVPFSVFVRAGGPGIGGVTLTVIGAFDGVPGDTAPGNGNYDLPAETVTSGQITIQ